MASTSELPERAGPRQPWAAALVVVVLAGAMWLARPGAATGAAVGVAVVLLLLALRPPKGWRQHLLMGTVLALGVAAGVGSWRLWRIEHRWAAVEGERLEASIGALTDELADTRALLLRLAGVATEMAAGRDRGRAFRALDVAVGDGALEVGVAVLEPTGVPWAWGGRQRLFPTLGGTPSGLRENSYEALLEVRRPAPGGRQVVASVLLWAHPAVPERDGSLAERFRQRTGSAFDIVLPRAPVPADCGEVVDYTEPTTAGEQRVFSACPKGPSQAQAHDEAAAAAARVVGPLLLLALALGLALARASWERAALLGALAWLGLVGRLPAGAARVGILSLDTYFLALPGLDAGLGGGGLALVLAALLTSGVWLWRRQPARRPLTILLAAGAIVAAPVAGRWIASGITLPAAGASAPLWAAWQLLVFGGVAACLVPAAGLLRHPARGASPAWPALLGALLALALAATAPSAWRPDGSWTAAWLLGWMVAGALVAQPATRTIAVTTIGLAAGAAAGALTWGAELARRVDAAEDGVRRVAAPIDPAAQRLLGELGDSLALRLAAPQTPTELYVAWRGSRIGQDRYPASLALWSPGGELRAALVLDSLDLPAGRLPALVTQLPRSLPRQVVTIPRPRGTHEVLVQRLTDSLVITVAVGPHSPLIHPSRAGRLIDPQARGPGLYELALASARAVDPDAIGRWRAEGRRLVHVHRLGDGDRAIRAVVPRGSWGARAVRGALLALLDVAALAALWALATLAGARRPAWPVPPLSTRSFRTRLAFSLALFAVLPAAAFAALSFGRLADAIRSSRFERALQDLGVAARELEERSARGEARLDLAALARAVDAEFALYRDARLTGASAPILVDLGVLPELLPPEAYRQLRLAAEPSLTLEGPLPSLAERLGFRALAVRDTQLTTLATAQPLDERPPGGDDPVDLALFVVLVAAVGAGAAAAAAGAAAESLARPVSELRRAALAIG
ncbi:MAG: hypothetical protein NW201_11075, partial [Gemmatimonadales bacterium]|nr:hypothetical protein [Gemmatimonadales bacterium]